MKYAPKQAQYEQMIREKLADNHFTNYIGFELTELTPGSCYGRMAIKEEFKQQIGFLHGGLTMTIADIVMGVAAFTLVNEGEHVVTAHLQNAFLNPAVGDYLYAKGYVIKAGKMLYFCEAELWTENDGIKTDVAKASSSMAVVRPVS
jgi:uncharacterized protein (TIGR00369 family)